MKGMLKEELFAGVPLEQLLMKIENLVEGGVAADSLANMGGTAAEDNAGVEPEQAELDELEEDVDVTEVWIVRHGQRFDEVRGNNWRAVCGDAWFDPPLTAKGKEQAEGAARQLQAFLTQKGADASFDEVFCSPLQRCVSTAEPFSQLFGVPIRIVHGVGECCAALRGHMRDGDAWKTSPMYNALQSMEQLQALCPDAIFAEPDDVVDQYLGRGGDTCCGRLAQGKRRILVVTHREGIRDLTELAGNRMRNTPYCASAKFGFSHHGQSWGFDGFLNKNAVGKLRVTK